MILYHGSNVEVRKPQIIKSRKLLDFGAAFYLTSNYEQAKKWAIRTTERRAEGKPTVSSYSVDKKELDGLSLLIFDVPNKYWLHYVSAHRTDKTINDMYDIVIGPVANDQAIRTINDFLKGRFTEDIAIQLLLPQKLKDQYAFKTEKAVSILNLKEVIYV